MRQLNAKTKSKVFRMQDGTGGGAKWTNADKRHPYLKIEFWMNTANHFWNTGMYSEKSKEYFNDSIAKMAKDYNRSHVIN